MSIYQTRTFQRWARKQDIEDKSLCVAVREILSGLHDGDLGGGLIKKKSSAIRSGKTGQFPYIISN